MLMSWLEATKAQKVQSQMKMEFVLNYKWKKVGLNEG